MRRKNLTIALCVIMLLGCLFVASTTPGCTADQLAQVKVRMADLARVVGQFTREADVLDEMKAQMDAQIEAMPPGVQKAKAIETRDEIVRRVTEYRKHAQDANAAIAAINDALQDGDVGSAFEEAFRQTAPLLPPPWGPVVAAAGGLIIGLIRAARKQSIARQIVRSVDAVVAAATPEVKAEIKAAQGSAAKALVDSAQGKGRTLPF